MNWIDLFIVHRLEISINNIITCKLTEITYYMFEYVLIFCPIEPTIYYYCRYH